MARDNHKGGTAGLLPYCGQNTPYLILRPHSRAVFSNNDALTAFNLLEGVRKTEIRSK